MVRRTVRFLALICAVGLVTTLTACAADREGPPGTFTLVVGDSFPTTHPFSRDGAQFFVERATELSGGRLQFDGAGDQHWRSACWHARSTSPASGPRCWRP